MMKTDCGGGAFKTEINKNELVMQKVISYAEHDPFL